jgi:hypothetical protein
MTDSGLLFILFSQDFIFILPRETMRHRLPSNFRSAISNPSSFHNGRLGGTALAASEAIHDGEWSLRMAAASCCGGMVHLLIEGTASWSSVEAKNQKESVMRTQLSRE